MMTMMKLKCGNVNIIITPKMSKYHGKHLEAREVSTDSSSWMQSIQGHGAGTTTQGGDATRGLNNMCIKVRISDDFKGKCVCHFLL